MPWPAWSPDETINIVVGGLVTLASVYWGAKLALRQAREQRQSERHLVWVEELIRLITRYENRLVAVEMEIEQRKTGLTLRTQRYYLQSARDLLRHSQLGLVYAPKGSQPDVGAFGDMIRAGIATFRALVPIAGEDGTTPMVRILDSDLTIASGLKEITAHTAAVTEAKKNFAFSIRDQLRRGL